MTLNCSISIKLIKGDNVACLCRGEGGNPPANVTWFKDGEKISDVGTEYQTLSLLNVGGADRRTYKCIASSDPGEKYTDEKFIQVIIFCKYMIIPISISLTLTVIFTKKTIQNIFACNFH